MNRKLGMAASAVTLLAVLAFAVSMLVGSFEGSCLSSMLIALGFVPLTASFAACGGTKTRAFGNTALAFAAVYAVLIMLVYFAQLTAVRAGNLSEQASQLLDYRAFGLFFSYDLLGYGFMALSTFFTGFAVAPRGRADRALRILLWIHGSFFLCAALPLFGLFYPGMAGGDLIGILVLEFWCAYFIPVCALSYLYFKHRRRGEEPI